MKDIARKLKDIARKLKDIARKLKDITFQYRGWTVFIIAVIQIALGLYLREDIECFIKDLEWVKLAIVLLIAAPIAFFMWLWRTEDKQKELEFVNRENFVKDLENIADKEKTSASKIAAMERVVHEIETNNSESYKKMLIPFYKEYTCNTKFDYGTFCEKMKSYEESITYSIPYNYLSKIRDEKGITYIDDRFISFFLTNKLFDGKMLYEYSFSGLEPLSWENNSFTVSNTTFDHCYFYGISFKKVMFKNIKFNFCYFQRAILTECTFNNCEFNNVAFNCAYMPKTKFENIKQFNNSSLTHAFIEKEAKSNIQKIADEYTKQCMEPISVFQNSAN